MFEANIGTPQAPIQQPPLGNFLPQDSVDVIEMLDLTMVKQKLMLEPPEGKGWTQQQADEVELWYRRYLILNLKYPGSSLVPNGPIDILWHQHILDTVAYRADCERIFGFFLDHYPYFGMDDVSDQSDLDAAFEQTNKLYRSEFGEDCSVMYVFSSVQNGVNCKSKCGAGCRQKCKSR